MASRTAENYNSEMTAPAFGGILSRYAVSKILKFERSESADNEIFYIHDCQWIRSRQYLELESVVSELSKVVCVRYSFRHDGNNFVVVSYLHQGKFEIAVMLDVSRNANDCFLRTLTTEELSEIAPFVAELEEDLRTCPISMSLN